MASTEIHRATPRIAVAGVSGYAGGELARLLLRHPRLSPADVLFLGRSDSRDSVTLEALHPQLTALVSANPTVERFSWERLSGFGADVLLLATPHEQSRELVPQAMALGLRVIDLSGAWRLKEETNRAVYKLTDRDALLAAELQTEAVFGSPELHGEVIAKARLVANPGCYATSVILALKPLVQAGLVDLGRGIIVDAKSGVSGAGKAPTANTHFMYAADNLSAYSVFNHRHTGELLEQLALTEEQIQFTPHLLPIPRGILSTIYLQLKQPTTEDTLHAIFEDFYRDAPLVRVRAPGTLPQIQHVVRTSFCDLGFALGPDMKRVVLVACLDNLLKGAASQAVQNLNLMLGWGEAEGLL